MKLTAAENSLRIQRAIKNQSAPPYSNKFSRVCDKRLTYNTEIYLKIFSLIKNR